MPRDLSALRIDHEPFRPSSRSRGWAIGLGVVLLLAAAAGGAAILLPRLRPPAVETFAVVRALPTRGTEVLQASGYLVPQRRSQVASRIPGVVEWIGFVEGDTVEEGQELVRLESRDLAAAVAQAEAALALAQANNRRLQEAGPGVVSDAEREQAQLQVQLRERAIDEARVQLGYASIRAPFRGVITQKSVEVGASLGTMGLRGAGGGVCTLVDLESLQAEVDVGEKHIHRLRRGQPADLFVEAVPDRTYRGEVDQIIQAADRQKATVRVKVRLLDSDERLLPDMSVRAIFLESADESAAASRPEVWIPREALVERDGRTQVLLVRDGRLEARGVRLGASREGRVSVEEGLAGGETIVRRPTADLSAGARVRTEEPK